MLDRIATLATRRARTIVALAVVAAVIAGALGGSVADRLGPYSADDPATETIKTENLVSKATGAHLDGAFVVLVRPGEPVRSPAGRRRVAEVAGEVRGTEGIARAVTPFDGGSPEMVSRDGRSAFIAGPMRHGAEREDVDKRLQRRLGDAPGVQLGGRGAAETKVNKIIEEDLRRAEMLAFPLLFLLSFWFFRSLVAAALPPLVGGLSIVFTFLGLRVVSEFTDVSVFALNLVTGLGLGLAIDYSLFIVARYREEIAKTGPGRDALARTLGSAGRTVLFSSLTVAAALASLLVFPQRFLYSMGVGGLLVALIAAVVALIVLPAVLALLGDRVNSLAPRRLRQAAEAEARPATSGGWYRLSRFVQRRPGRVAVVTAILLVAMGTPFLGIRFTAVDATVLPKETEARKVDTALKTEFAPNQASPLVVVAQTGDPAAARRLAARLKRDPAVRTVYPPQRLDRGLWRIDAIPRKGPLTGTSQDLLHRVRELPAAFPIGVSGETADFVDQKQSIRDHMPLVLSILAVTTLVILFAMTGSLILPVKALLMNVLTLSAAFGLLVLIFQDGRFEGLLGYTSQGALEFSQPLVLLAVAFGLSTDYGVFLLSRIKEARDRGASDSEAVAIGLERTGRIVTAAALLFTIAIGAFATSRIIFIKEVGIGTALAVLIDASIIRALLVPSLMQLLGRWNWWAPRPLRRLHERFGVSDAQAPGPAAAG
jgi:uncharacterized membrane protein YdfJ with MMPL/SSD domain